MITIIIIALEQSYNKVIIFFSKTAMFNYLDHS